MTMDPDNDWEEGPSVSIFPEADENDPAAPEEEIYFKPQEPPRAAPRAAPGKEPKPRSPFSARLIYTLIFSIIVLSVLVVYALFAGDRIDRIAEEQNRLWGARVEALENRLNSVEERLKLLEERPQPVPKQAAPKKKKSGS